MTAIKDKLESFVATNHGWECVFSSSQETFCPNFHITLTIDVDSKIKI